MVPPRGEFSADRVIELALRQDFGPDPSLSSFRKNFKVLDDHMLTQVNEYKKKYRDKDPLIAAED